MLIVSDKQVKQALGEVLAKLCDEGNIERYDADIVNTLGKSLLQAISAKVE